MLVPDGPDNLVCPFHNKYMKKVCRTCPLWVCLKGTNPQTGESVDNWQCAVATLPMLLVENARYSRGTQAAVESARNESVKDQEALRETLVAIEQVKRKPQKLIEVQNG